MFSLENKIALITGSTAGIGLSIAKKLHEAGATVIITGRNQEMLDTIKNELKTRVLTIAFDLSQTDKIQTFAKDVLELAGGRVDILVNNAGITRDTLAIRMTDDMWNDVINTNLTAQFKLTRELIQPMMKNRWGRIINNASIIAAIGNAGQANYAAAKAGLIGLTKSLSMELGSRNITVNAIAPGFIQTKMTDVLPEEIKQSMLKQIPLGKFGMPDDIANAVLFLAAEETGYITGQTIHVNGGMMRF